MEIKRRSIDRQMPEGFWVCASILVGVLIMIAVLVVYG